MGILIGSVSHLSYTFYTLEEKDSLGFVSFTISLGIEAGMLAIAFGIAERRRAGRRIIDLLFYQVFFAAVNFYGNLLLYPCMLLVKWWWTKRDEWKQNKANGSIEFCLPTQGQLACQ
jgi:hypothetical protein